MLCENLPYIKAIYGEQRLEKSWCVTVSKSIIETGTM